MAELIQFDAPRADWLELWKGPLHFRATFVGGKFGPGHSFDDINKSGLGRSKDREIYTVRADPVDGAIVIEWQVGLPGQKPPFSTERYHDGGPGRDHYSRLKNDGAFRKRHLHHLPPELRSRAVAAYAIAASMRESLIEEFFNAIHEGQCGVWARIGSIVAPFARVPADVFSSYSVKNWGYGQPGAARAELEGFESLYSIHVEPSASAPLLPKLVEVNAASRAPAVKEGHPPTNDEILTKADEMKLRGLVGYEIAKQMRLEQGFSNVATTHVRELIKGRWKGGRPKAKGAH